jgi:hypothetical protein
VVVGAYTDKRGGVCPMLAAHRNGGRTDFGAFARAWDAYVGAKKPRRATAREVRTLKGYLELSLVREGIRPEQSLPRESTLTETVREVKAARRSRAERAARDAADISVEELLAASEREGAAQLADLHEGHLDVPGP